MSATRAAAARLTLDADLAVRVAELDAAHPPGAPGAGIFRSAAAVEVARSAVGTWTLSLAAQAAGQSEAGVVAAVLYKLGYGTATSCRDRALEIVGGAS